jgi:hypothetical protein
MTADIVRLPQPSHGRLECSSCGATTEAQCGCGVPYLPAGARAAKAVAENPGMSDRAIASVVARHAPQDRAGAWVQRIEESVSDADLHLIMLRGATPHV